MKAASRPARFIIGDNIEPAHDEYRPGFTVGVRLKLGEEMEGLEVFDDGISFRSPEAIEGGRLIELVLCKGAVLVDAIVVGCVPLRDAESHYAIRARYYKTSQALNALIREELGRQLRNEHRSIED